MLPNNTFEGRTGIITGGGTGIGFGMARKLVSLGATVVIASRSEEHLAPAVETLRSESGRADAAHFIAVDVRDPEAVEAMAAKVESDHGKIDFLVNNAAGNFISRTEDLSTRGFDAVANIVLHGTFYVTHAVGRRWIASGHRGNVVSIVVTWVYNGSPYVVPSVMSKSGVHAMTMSLATEWAHYGIRLNAIAPGVIPTEGASKRLNPGASPSERTERSNPMGRVGRMEELQNLATFLLADGCEWLTGQTITLDGGQSNATGSNFYELRHWTDEQWQAARAAIKAQNDKDRAQRA